jgi:hypothetical protein
MPPKRQVTGDDGGKREAEQNERLPTPDLDLGCTVDDLARYRRRSATGRRGIGQKRFSDGRQGYGVRPDVAAADGKHRNPEQGQRHNKVDEPTTQLAHPAVIAVPPPVHILASRHLPASSAPRTARSCSRLVKQGSWARVGRQCGHPFGFLCPKKVAVLPCP